MKNATLAQGNQVLNLILQKKVPTKQLQELLGSGLLSDLLDANVAMVNRVEFRKMIGLRSAFPTWRTIRRTLTSSADAVEKLEAARHEISDWAGIILPKVVFDGDGEYELVVASNADLGLTGNSIKLLETYVHAERFALELCPAWVGPQLRLDYTGQPLGERLVIAMEAISGTDVYLCVFHVERGGDGSYLAASDGDLDICYDAADLFVFIRRK